MVEEDQTKAELAAVHKPLLTSNSSNSIETLASGTEEIKIRRLTLSNVTLISKSLSNIRRDDNETTIGFDCEDWDSSGTTKSSGASLLSCPVLFKSSLASGNISRSVSTLCAFLTILIAFLTLLYLYIVQTSPAPIQTLQVNEAGVFLAQVVLKTSSAKPLLQEQEFTRWEWKSVPKLAVGKSKLHIQVQKTHRSKSQHSGNLQDTRIKAEVDDDTLAISGRPAFCTKTTSDIPRAITLENVKSLHLTNMDDCSHYMKLILVDWEFPQIHHIKLENVVIREIEFTALTKFIDRHSKTLHKVEITESYLCPSPACDAGMINFPDHDFQVIVTRRKESPEWM